MMSAQSPITNDNSTSRYFNYNTTNDYVSPNKVIATTRSFKYDNNVAPYVDAPKAYNPFTYTNTNNPNNNNNLGAASPSSINNGDLQSTQRKSVSFSMNVPNSKTDRTLNLDLSNSVLIKNGNNDQSFINQNSAMDRSLIKNLSTSQLPNIQQSQASFYNKQNQSMSTSALSNRSFLNKTGMSKKNILTEKAMKNPSVFNTIAQESIFTNISYQANKDYDYSYDPRDGFNIKIDKVEIPFPATQIKSLKLSYEILDGDTESLLFSEKAKTLHYDDIFSQFQKINYTQNIKNFLVNPDYHIFIYADYVLYDVQNQLYDYFKSFTFIPIFRKEGLNSGCHSLKFLQYLSNSSANDPIKATKGHQFPAASNINCYIRICRPKSTLDMVKMEDIKKVQYKQDASTHREERHEVEGFWAKKKRQQDEDAYKKYLEEQARLHSKKPQDKSKFNYAGNSYDLVPVSRYSHFTTKVPRKHVYGYQKQGKTSIDHYV